MTIIATRPYLTAAVVSEDRKDAAFTLNGKRQVCTGLLFLKGELIFVI